MHDQIITQALQWIDDNAAERTDTAYLAEKARGADLAPAAREAIMSLPEGEYSKAELKQMVEDALLAKIGSAGATMRGFGGSM